MSLILLDWSDNHEVDLVGYNIYRSTTSGSGYVKLNSTPLTSSDYIDPNVSGNTIYYYIVTAIDTGNLESVPSAEVSAALSHPAMGTGAILREWWLNIPGEAVSNLFNNANYPSNPSGRQLITKLEGPVNWADDYGTRIYGYLNPVTSGNYVFWIAGENESRLYLSTNSSPYNIAIIASVPDLTGYQEWNMYPEQQSPPVWLVAGQNYYIMVIHKAGTGGDHVSVAWEGPGISQQIIDGIYLSPCCLKFIDFSDFANQWGRTDCDASNDWCSGTDFSRDGSVGIDDIAAFAEGWLVGPI
jgi:hypothetical protein